MIRNLPPTHERARACKLRGPRATKAHRGTVERDAVVEPLLNCWHCGAVIGVQIWPPTEPVLAGLCPGCGGWLSVDFRGEGQGVALPAARRTTAQSKEPGDTPRGVIRPASWNRRSGSVDPLFVPRLARQGKLLQIDNPATWKQSAPSRAATAGGLNRRVKFFGAAACLAALLGLAPPAGQTAQRPLRLTESGATGKSPQIRDLRNVGAPLQEESFTTPDEGNSRSRGLDEFLPKELAAISPLRRTPAPERLTSPPLYPAASKASVPGAAAPAGLERKQVSLQE